MTASEVARNFSAVLDQIEHGESIVVTRGGWRVALIKPTASANGGELRQVLRKWQDGPAVR